MALAYSPDVKACTAANADDQRVCIKLSDKVYVYIRSVLCRLAYEPQNGFIIDLTNTSPQLLHTFSTGLADTCRDTGCMV